VKDLFEREQQVCDNALTYISERKNGAPYDLADYETLAKEYGRLLKQLRRVTKLSDKTTVDLNTSKIDLQGKVHYDALTGIYNRRFMDERLQQIVKSLSRSGGMLSVLMIDIDFFKKYNDTYGHSMGDNCLGTVAGALKNTVTRGDDFTARYGGEEFAVVLPNTDESGAREVAGKLLENVRACEIPHEQNTAASCVTISIGVTTGAVNYPRNGDDYIKRADEALYMSKQNGRNRYTFLHFEEVLQ
jgi:diguanylate cyclase (GGDEF)-like protein